MSATSVSTSIGRKFCAASIQPRFMTSGTAITAASEDCLSRLTSALQAARRIRRSDLRQDDPPEALRRRQADHAGGVPLPARHRQRCAPRKISDICALELQASAPATTVKAIEPDVGDHRQRVVRPDDVHERRRGAEEIDQATASGRTTGTSALRAIAIGSAATVPAAKATAVIAERERHAQEQPGKVSR